MSPNDNIFRGSEFRGPIYEGSIGERLHRSMKTFEPEKILQVDGITGVTTTAAQLLDMSVRTAAGLKKQGMNIGDVAVFVGSNSAEIFTAVLATLFCNGVAAPIDPSMKVLELLHMLRICEPKFIFCEEKLVQNVKEACKQAGNETKIIILDAKQEVSSYINFQDLLLSDVDVDGFEVEPIQDPKTQLVYIISSSGSTGLPKGVGLTHFNMNCQLAAIDDLPPQVKMSSFMQLTQFYWVSGLYTLTLLSMIGSKRVFIPGFDEVPLLTAIQKYKANWMVMSPAELANMLNYPDLHKYDLSSVALIATAGSALQPGLVNLLRKKLGNKIGVTQAYGMTEMTAIVSTPSVQYNTATVGKLGPGLEGKVISLEDGRALGPMEVGEFCFRGPVVMKCYVNNEAETQEAIDEEGWLHTGDVGYYDHDELLYLVDRIKEFIKYRTWQVPPAELESLITTLPGVKDVAVTCVPHKVDISHPLALVVKREDAVVTEEEITKLVAENLSEHKQLRAGVIFVDQVSRTPVGKLRRKLIKETALELYQNKQ